MIYTRIVSRGTGRTSLILALLTPVSAIAMLGVHFLLSGMYLEITRLEFFAITYLMICAAVMCVIGFILERRKAAMSAAVENKALAEGYTDEFFDFCLKNCEKISFKRRKAMALLCTAMYYADAKRYDEAVELVSKIDLVPLKDKERCAYYVTLSYILFVMGDENGADAAYASNTSLLQKYAQKKNGKTNLGCAAALVSCLMCYEEEKSEELAAKLFAVREATRKTEIAAVCSELLCLISLDMGEVCAAKRYAADAYCHAIMYGQRCRVQKLMRIIESFYGVE